MPILSLLLANWPAPPGISALTTTRLGGNSISPYASNNFGLHVSDKQEHVLLNRQQLIAHLELPSEPAWLEQTHSTRCVVVEEESERTADAAITRQRDIPLVVMTADCLPIVLCNQEGTEIAVVHAGWRGLVNGIVESTLSKMTSSTATLMAWIGPAICQRCFEIGDEVRSAYIEKYPFTKATFTTKGIKQFANLPKMAELVLHAAGVAAVYQSSACTFEQKNEFYSYRREPQTGRMATLIWFSSKDNR